MLAQRVTWGLMWIQSPSIASFTRQNFQSNIDSKIGQGPSMDSTLGTASRHHDKILQCCYFNAKCCRRSLKKVREGVNIKKTSLNHQNYIQCSQFLQCHALKVLWWSHRLKNFMPPLLLESRFNTEAGGGICCDVVRVSPIWHYLGTILSKVGIEHRQLVNYAGTTNSMQNNSVQKQTRNILQIRMFLQIFLITLRGQRLNFLKIQAGLEMQWNIKKLHWTQKITFF